MPMADRKCRGMVLNREETGIFEEWAIQDEPREECGVFGMYDFSAQENVASTIYYGLFALQHRGQESCGIAVSSTSGPKGKVRSRKGMGLVNETFEEEDFDSLTGDIRGGINAGIKTCWVNLKGKARRPDIVPNYEIHSLKELMELL